MTQKHPPSQSVIKSFGGNCNPKKLPGGQNLNYIADDIVFKPAPDNEETNWIADFYTKTKIQGIRLPAPVTNHDGHYVTGGWQAWKYLEGQHNFDDWTKVIEICKQFHEGIKHLPEPAFFKNRDQNPWVIADKAAWGEIIIDFHPDLTPIINKLQKQLKPVCAQSQLIHGDFGGNVLFSQGKDPLVIDFSPYWRPASFAVAVVIADAVVWNNAGLDFAEKYCHNNNMIQYILRAELRRVIELDRLYFMYGINKINEIQHHKKFIDFICSIF